MSGTDIKIVFMDGETAEHYAENWFYHEGTYCVVLGGWPSKTVRYPLDNIRSIEEKK